MIKLQLEVPSPWSWDYFKNLGCLHGKLTQHKMWELEHTYYSGSLLDVTFRLTTRGDHAGLELVFGIFGYGVSFRIYDTRHWNSTTNAWQTYKFDAESNTWQAH